MSSASPLTAAAVRPNLPLAELAMRWSYRGAFGWLIGLLPGLGILILSGQTPAQLGIMIGGFALCWTLGGMLFSLVTLPYSSFLTLRAFWQPESRKQRWFALAINLLAWGLGGLPSLLALLLATAETGS